jgi:DNA-binding Xre family transcriptional regulator
MPEYFDEVFPLGGPLMCSYSAVADLARLAAIIGPSITRLVEAYTAAYRTITSAPLDPAEIRDVAINTVRFRFGFRLGRFNSDRLFDDAEFELALSYELVQIGGASQRRLEPGNRRRPATTRHAGKRFPTRAVWLQERLAERGWSRHDSARHGGPDYKTVDKILRGEPVREDTLEKLANALSKKPGKAKLELISIPRD